MMKTEKKKVGMKQLVKAGVLSAEQAINRLKEKAEVDSGNFGDKLLEESAAYKWLVRRK